jgi:hypothetical protein
MFLANTLWLRIFYHNSKNSEYFSADGSEALYSSSSTKKSIIGSIDSSFQINGKYEFLYEVPGMRGYNRWRQLKHPINTTLWMKSEDNGFQPVKLSWSFNFGHLRKCNDYSVFCCSNNSGWWWYPIGAKSYNIYETELPLIYYDIDTVYQGHEVALWIRVPPKIENVSFRITCCLYKFHGKSNLCYVFLALLIS